MADKDIPVVHDQNLLLGTGSSSLVQIAEERAKSDVGDGANPPHIGKCTSEKKLYFFWMKSGCHAFVVLSPTKSTFERLCKALDA
jgi:hypothetical protein